MHLLPARTTICLLLALLWGSQAASLTSSDEFEIVRQLNLHQAYTDNNASLASATLWLSLYWPDATFTNVDLLSGTSSRSGASPSDNNGLKYFYDYDHSVFPLEQWYHSIDRFQIEDTGNSSQARTHWRWRVDWRANTTGVVSTGYYDDVFEKRNGVWKCKLRVSHVDPNWPTWLFAPYAEQANSTFHHSG